MFKLLLLLLFSMQALSAEEPVDLRICGEPERYANGVIKRSKSVKAYFKKIHPCPVTGESSGPCPGWSIDHVIPLSCGGCDSIANMQWLPNRIKSAAGKYPKDRWERKINCLPMTLIKRE